MVVIKKHEKRNLVLPRNTMEDAFKIEFSKCLKEDSAYATNRKMLPVVCRMYDLMELASPIFT